MNIIILLGTPKKSGETIRHAQLYGERLALFPDVNVEYLYLKDYDIKECKGCSLCFDRGGNYCPLKDDRDEVINKLESAHGLIVIAPIYSLHIPSTLKKLIDRLSFFFHRPRFFGKKAFVVVPKGIMFPGIDTYLLKILAAWGYEVTGSDTMPIAEYFPEKKRAKALKKIASNMQSFYSTLKNNKTGSPTLFDLVSFSIWKMRALMKDETNADYLYFRDNGLFDKPYFYDVRINPLKRIISSLLSGLAISYMKRKFGDLKRAI